MLTIVTITFNNLDGLKKTGASIAAQGCSGFKWVVVDGGSRDGTVEFLESSRNVSEFISEPDSGIYDAMGKGFSLCKEGYVLFLNAGDELNSPTSLSAARECLGDHDVYFFDTVVVSGSKRWLRRARPLSAAKYSVPAIQQSTIYRVRSLRELEWPGDYRICGDYSLAAQLFRAQSTHQVHHFALSTFHVGGVSTFSVLALCREADQIQKKYLGTPLVVRGIFLFRRILAGTVVRILHAIP